MRSVEQAIAYAIGQLGRSDDEGFCLRFVAACYGVPITGLGSAIELCFRLRLAGLLHPHTPPSAGALVFYDPPGGDHIPAALRGFGHVTLALGACWEIGTSWPQYPGAVGIRQHAWTVGCLGWAAPWVALAEQDTESEATT